MPSFVTDFETRHTDAFAESGLVHAGVLLALTELAYARFEDAVGIQKERPVYAVQRATEATYQTPLHWQEGARIEVRTLSVSDGSFDQEFAVRSARDDRPIAVFVHHWIWMDTATQKRVPLSEAVRAKLVTD
jgi:acyl-CoA thioesterase FadM